jgi:P27 family predicted phage terminase small subunit
MPGPKPKPTALKVLQGNPGHQKLNKNEPNPRPIVPDCPSWLNAGAQAIWDRLVPELDYCGVLTAVDQSALAGYCSAYEEAGRLESFIDEYGYTVETPSGYLQQRPEVAIRNKAWDRVDKFAAQLGIGAAHRARIDVEKRDDEAKDTASEILAVTARR